MFKSLKLYTGETINLEELIAKLVDFSYTRQERVASEGDFSSRGAIVDIYPFTFELSLRVELDFDKISSIRTFNPIDGSFLWAHTMVIILPFKDRHSAKSSFRQDFPIDNFLDIKTGDYVVHNQHGIGKFLGFEKIKLGVKSKDHLVIEYENQEKLYVPVEAMNLVQKYISFQAKKPRLYRLGSKEWLRTSQRVRKGIQRLAWELLSLQAMRLSAAGFKYSSDTDWQRQFEGTFLYEETPDQIKVVEEVKLDMESGRLMDRLVCGDVGYGKTEVAMRAAFKACVDGKQVAYLVPTTILAEQHFQNFTARLSDFPIVVEMLSRFKTKHEQKEIIERIRLGKVDMVIGTHRLLSDDVSFNNLGLVIIDEEQRFGVRAKERLKKLRLTTDVITLTATPIPRTLYMSLMGAKDLSVMNTPVQNRLPITSVLAEYDADLMRQAISRELNRKGQVYVLHNKVYDIEKIRDSVAKVAGSQTKIAVAHGQMPAKMLEAVILDFLKAKIDILVCTMIIESGIDVPNANTIIINNAHTFGLADLHQLRGRVGRFNRQAYAYFLVPKHFKHTPETSKRLDAINEYSHLGSGFRIAMEDLELRGAGNLLGVQQHGFIASVGFDFYCRLLKETISTLSKAGLYDYKYQ